MCDILKIKKKDAQMGELGSGKLEKERERERGWIGRGWQSSDTTM